LENKVTISAVSSEIGHSTIGTIPSPVSMRVIEDVDSVGTQSSVCTVSASASVGVVVSISTSVSVVSIVSIGGTVEASFDDAVSVWGEGEDSTDVGASMFSHDSS
jgi:hypothetical protein